VPKKITTTKIRLSHTKRDTLTLIRCTSDIFKVSNEYHRRYTTNTHCNSGLMPGTHTSADTRQ